MVPLAEEKKGPWIKSDGADIFFACLIVLNSIVLGIDIEVSLRSGGDSGPVLFWIQFGFLVIFVAELLLRVKADGLAFFSICRNPSGLFDVIIVGTSVAEFVVNLLVEGGESPLGAVSIMRIFRLLRIARVARLLKVCPELSLLVGGLAASMQAVFWVFCMLVVIMYICALICCMELGRTDDEDLRYYFGSVGSSFWTHFMVVTLEGYPSVAAAAGKESWLWYVYIVGFILFSNVVLMNLVTGIVCESIVTKAEDEESQSLVYEEESRKFGEVMYELLCLQGYSPESELCFEDFEQVVKDPNVREALNVLEICLDMEDRALWDILDEDSTGKLSVQAFIENLLRLRGSKDVLHSLVVQADIIRGGHSVREAFDEAEAGARQYATSLCGALQNKLLQRLSLIPGQAEDASTGRWPPNHRGEQRLHSRHAVLRPDAVHGAARPAEEPRSSSRPIEASVVLSANAEDIQPAGATPAAISRASFDAEELRPDASLPLAASAPASRSGEDVRPAAAASITASRASRDAEEVCPHASIPLEASRAASRSAEEPHTPAAAPASASRPSRNAEAPDPVAAAPAAASSSSRPNEAPDPVAAAPAAASSSSRPDETAAATAAVTSAASSASRPCEAVAPAAAAPSAASSTSRPCEASPSSDLEPPQGRQAASSSQDGPAAEQPPAPSTEARVHGILADLESSSYEARQTLSRLGEDLAASRNRIRELEAELARRKEASRIELARRVDEASAFSWPSQCSPRALVQKGQKSTSARELRLLPGVEPRHRPAAPEAAEPAEGALLAGPSAAWDRRAAAGGELDRALQHVWQRQQPQSPAVAPAAAAPATAAPAAAAPAAAVPHPAATISTSPPSTAAASPARGTPPPSAVATSPARGMVAAAAAAAAASCSMEASPQTATGLSTTGATTGVALASTVATPRTAVPRAAAPPRSAARNECMAHRRRLEAACASAASPKAAVAPAAGRPRGGAPRQRYLNAFHGHPPDFQSIAKAATYESSDEELGGAPARSES